MWWKRLKRRHRFARKRNLTYLLFLFILLSISNSSAKLTYKVGLMSSPEMNLLNNSALQRIGGWYWLASASYLDGFSTAYNTYMYARGGMSDHYEDFVVGVRPAISLIPGIAYLVGNGSMTKSYILDSDYVLS